MKVKVAINGFGRIGRSFFRAAIEDDIIDVVAINDLAKGEALAHLLKYDSLRGRLPYEVSLSGENILVGKKPTKLLSEKDLSKLHWDKVGADIVLESTGVLNKVAARHLDQGAKKVVISCPAPTADAAFIMGINEQLYDPAKHHVVSNASCTSNCLAMMVKVLQESFGGVESGFITNVHAVSRLQVVHDTNHEDLRMARAAGLNMMPHNPGMAVAISRVMPELEGVLEDYTIRVPVPVGSLVDLKAVVKRQATVQEINQAMRRAALWGKLSPYLEYAEDPIVSSDIISNPASCIFDPSLTQAMGNQVRVVGWHDNEWGYSNRLIDLVKYIGSKL